MANHKETHILSWILSGLIVAIATVAVILGSTDGAQSAPAGQSAQAGQSAPDDGAPIPAGSSDKARP